MHTIEIAGLTIGFQYSSDEKAEKYFGDYLLKTQGRSPDMILDAQKWMDKIIVESERSQSRESAEFYAVSVSMGNQLPRFDRLQIHGVAIEYEGKAYIFTAPSGTGKSTRAFLLQKYLGDDKVTVINGDKPVLWFKDDEVLACGSPWAGKEGLNRNVCVPLGGICLLKRNPANIVRKADAGDFFDFFISQVQMPDSSDLILKALGLMEKLYGKVPSYFLENDITEQGVKLCYETLTGKDFEKNRL